MDMDSKLGTSRLKLVALKAEFEAFKITSISRNYELETIIGEKNVELNSAINTFEKNLQNNGKTIQISNEKIFNLENQIKTSTNLHENFKIKMNAEIKILTDIQNVTQLEYNSNKENEIRNIDLLNDSYKSKLRNDMLEKEIALLKKESMNVSNIYDDKFQNHENKLNNDKDLFEKKNIEKINEITVLTVKYADQKCDHEKLKEENVANDSHRESKEIAMVGKYEALELKLKNSEYQILTDNYTIKEEMKEKMHEKMNGLLRDIDNLKDDKDRLKIIKNTLYKEKGNLQDTVERMKTESESSREESQRLHTIQIGNLEHDHRKEIASLICVSTTQTTEFELQMKECINLSNELALMQASDIALKSEKSNQIIETLDKNLKILALELKGKIQNNEKISREVKVITDNGLMKNDAFPKLKSENSNYQDELKIESLLISNHQMMYGKLRKSTRFIIRAILYLEITVNILNGLVSILTPALALQGMTNVDLFSGEHLIGLEAQRWFGLMGFVFGGVMLLRVLDQPLALKFLLEGLLLGDVLYAACLVPFTLRFGKLPMILVPFILTSIMFVARLVLYIYEDWPSIILQADPAKKRKISQ